MSKSHGNSYQYTFDPDYVRPTVSMTLPQYKRRQATYNGKTVKLSPLTTELLVIFLLRQGDVLDKDFLVNCLWPDPDYMPEYWGDVFGHMLMKLRREIPGCIFTVGKRGYIMDKLDGKKLLGLP